jgi:hypothetical protein
MTQAKVVQAPAPAAPAAPAAPGVTIVTPQALAGPPATAKEVRALKAQRNELSDQLNSATSRRREIARQLQSATGADKAGLEQRLGVLDARISRLETSIDQVGQQLASAPVALVASTEQPGAAQDKLNELWGPILIVFTIFVLCPVAIAFARSLWKRGSRPQVTTDRDTMLRLERMEQAVDAIAVEIERVSEGQRFVTRILAEGKTAIPIPAVNAEQGERVRG